MKSNECVVVGRACAKYFMINYLIIRERLWDHCLGASGAPDLDDHSWIDGLVFAQRSKGTVYQTNFLCCHMHRARKNFTTLK